MKYFPYMEFVVVDYTGYIALDNYFLRHYTSVAAEVDQLDFPIDLALDYCMGPDFHTYFEAEGVLEEHKLHTVHFQHFRLELPIAVSSAHMGQRTSFLHLVEQN